MLGALASTLTIPRKTRHAGHLQTGSPLYRPWLGGQNTHWPSGTGFHAIHVNFIRRDDGPARTDVTRPWVNTSDPRQSGSASTRGHIVRRCGQRWARLLRERMERHRARPSAPEWLLTGGIDLQHHQHVHLGKHIREIFVEILGTASGAGGTPSPAASRASRRGADGHLHFARVMTVIVHQTWPCHGRFPNSPYCWKRRPHPGANLESA